MEIYEERLQDVSFYGEGDCKVSSGGSCRMRCSRLSVLSEPSCVAVYASNTSAFSENAEEKMHCTAAEGAELPVPGCSDGHECGGTGRLFRGECGACQCKGSGRLYEKGSDILDEFRYIESQLRLSVPVEELFLDLGKRSGVEDIENFAAVFYTAKRTGGDMTQVIQKVARMLSDKIEVKKEIEATLAAKKSEQMVMSIMPAGIICYLKLTSPGFLDVLYGNPFGICAMTVCMVIYGLSYWLGVKIVDIEV